MRLFSSESQFKPFSALTAFDNLTSFNIRQLLRNLLLFCSSWNRYSQLGLHISSVMENKLHPRTLLKCSLSLISGCFGRAQRWLLGGTDTRNWGVISIAGLLSLPRELLCFTGLLIWFKATYHSDTILTQSAKGHIGHTLIYFLFLSRLWLIRNDSNWA